MMLPIPNAELYKLEAVSMYTCCLSWKFALISVMIIGIRGIIENEAENPKMDIPVNITQMFSLNPQKYDGPISKNPMLIRSFPIQRRMLLSIFSITLTTIIPEIIGKINGRAKNSPYSLSVTFISESLLDKIAGEKFKSIRSITAKNRHLNTVYSCQI